MALRKRELLILLLLTLPACAKHQVGSGGVSGPAPTPAPTPQPSRVLQAWISGSSAVDAQGTYGTQGAPNATNVPGARSEGAAARDASGSLWLFGGSGLDGGAASGNQRSGGDLNDLWKFSPSTRQWTWMSGSNLAGQGATYGTPGVPATTNVPAARKGSVAWTDAAGNFWLFGGCGSGNCYNDLWEFLPRTGAWAWMAGSALTGQGGVYGTQGVPNAMNTPGARIWAVSWTDAAGNFWLFGGQGLGGDGTSGISNELWKFVPGTGWAWMGGSNTTLSPGKYGVRGQASATNMPGARRAASARSDGAGNLWLFGGDGVDASGKIGYLNDLWKYSPASGQWTWMSGSTSANQNGSYGVQGVESASNAPGARQGAVTWSDGSDGIWLFGGLGNDSAGNPSTAGLNDLWRYSVTDGAWTWVSGATVGNQPGVYGSLGQAGTSFLPGSRSPGAAWADSSGNLWLFGGSGFDGRGLFQFLNDLWEISPRAPSPQDSRIF